MNNPKILVIDDIKDNILTIKAVILKNFPDAIILTAQDGFLGLELCKSTIPDLVILDILMPKKDGFEVCQEIKNTEKLNEIPIVFITALKDSVKLKVKALTVGGDGFLQKPIQEVELIAQIRAMLKLREASKYKEQEKENLLRLVNEKTYKLSESEKRYKGLVDNLDAGVVIHNNDTSVINCNLRAVELLGLKNDGKGYKADNACWNFLKPDGNKMEVEEYPVSIVKATLKPLKKYVLGILKDSKDNITWVNVNAVPRFDTYGILKEVVVSFTDISEVVDKENKLSYAANYDHLTGLINRRLFEQKMDELQTNGLYPVTIAVADINGLKLINDAFGHDYGDQMLIKAAQIIKASLPDTDITARTGGDEFGIIMYNTNSEQAEAKIKEIHRNTAGITVQAIELSIAIGYMTKSDSEGNIYDISKSAEDLMYRQKLITIPSMRSNAIHTILSTLYEKDEYSESHSRAVSIISERLATMKKLNFSDVSQVKTAGLLHDIGKTIIPSEILKKTGMLTENEFKIMQNHSEIGFRILNSSTELRTISNIVLNHHERWDGSGYPRGIKGEEIPIESRIITIADSFDAMTSNRPYRKAFSVDVAKKEIIDKSGSQFDPSLVRIFIDNFDKITKSIR